LWLADQLLEPTKLVFAIVIAESLREYRAVLTSPIHSGHYIASLALVGVYLTTVWSWLGWHRAHVKYPYEVGSGGESNQSEILRFYADLAIVIAYAYVLFQVEPLVEHPAGNLVWLLLGYPIIMSLYGAENVLRWYHYRGDARRTMPIPTALALFVGLTIGYVFVRREFTPSRGNDHDLLWLNATTLVVYIVVMWGYRALNEWWKGRITSADVGSSLDATSTAS
jgi:Ca2+/H+ antiporter